MTFPSSQGTKDSLDAAWDRARASAGNIKASAQNLRNKSAAGTATSEDILNTVANFAGLRDRLQKSAAVSGIAAYAQAQISDNTIDIVVEFNNLMTKIDAAISWVLTNFPKDASGFLLAIQFTADNTGRTQFRTFTALQTSGLRAALDDLIAAID